MSGRKNEEQIGEARTLGTHRGLPMPRLRRGEIACPVCSCAGRIDTTDKKAGTRILHDGRNFACRSEFARIEFLDEMEIPHA